MADATQRFGDAKRSYPMVQTSSSQATTTAKSSIWFHLALTAGFALLVYRSALIPSQILLTSDDNIGAMAMRKALLPGGLFRAWDDSVLSGQPSLLNLSWTNLVLWLLPVRVFQNIIHALDLMIASLCLGLFLRERGVRWVAAAVGALTAFWLGSTFFLTYAGHIGKFGVVMFAAVAVWCIECAARRRSWAWAVLGGGALGAMFLEQADVALFFAMVLGPYAIFATWRESGFQIKEHLRVVLPVAAFALIIGFRAIWLARAFFSLDASAEAPPENRQQVWSYCTQWSWPPSETLEWVAPGYFGWSSGDPSGPYWGRLGRSDDWEKTRQGFPNFKLETHYLGAIPLVLVALALYLAFLLRAVARPDVVFWTLAAALTFMLGLGKFTPLYRLFFELPGMSSIRAPVKFMQVTQFALGVLAALGLEGLLRVVTAPDKSRLPAARFAWFERTAGVLGGLMLLGAAGLANSSSAAIQAMAHQGWGQAATIMVDNRISGLVHGGLMLLGAGLGVALLVRIRKADLAERLAWLLVAVVAADQLALSGRYVKTVGAEGYAAANPATNFLKKEIGQQRVFLTTQGNFYGQWLTVLFPYHSIPTYNVAQIRMPADYQQFLDAMGQDLPRLWQYFAVGMVMGPSGIWPELQNKEPFRGRFELAYAYNVAPRGAGVDVIPAAANRPGQHVVVRHLAPAARFALLGRWEGLTTPALLQRLRNPATIPLQQAFVAPDVAARLPASGTNGPVGSVQVESYQPGHMVLKVSADQPTILRAADKFSPFWRARVDGVPVDVFRCDHVFTGCALTAGSHTVELEHRPPLHTLWLQLGGMAACAGAALFLFLRRRMVVA